MSAQFTIITEGSHSLSLPESDDPVQQIRKIFPRLSPRTQRSLLYLAREVLASEERERTGRALSPRSYRVAADVVMDLARADAAKKARNANRHSWMERRRATLLPERMRDA